MTETSDSSNTEFQPIPISTMAVTTNQLSKETTRSKIKRYSPMQLELDILELKLSIDICNQQLKCLKKMNKCISKLSDHQFDANKFQIIQEILKYQHSKKKLQKEVKKLKKIKRKMRFNKI